MALQKEKTLHGKILADYCKYSSGIVLVHCLYLVELGLITHTIHSSRFEVLAAFF